MDQNSNKNEISQTFNFISGALEKAQSNGSFTLKESVRIVEEMTKLARYIEAKENALREK